MLPDEKRCLATRQVAIYLAWLPKAYSDAHVQKATIAVGSSSPTFLTNWLDVIDGVFKRRFVKSRAPLFSLPKLMIQSPDGRFARSAPLMEGRTDDRSWGFPCGVGEANSKSAVPSGMSDLDFDAHERTPLFSASCFRFAKV